MKHTSATISATALDSRRLVSLKALAQILDTTRTSARRWLQEAGVQPLAIGRGRNGAIRYRWRDVEVWLESLQTVP